MSIFSPYTIDVPQSRVEDLIQKLGLTKFPDEIEATSWDFGCPLDDIKRLIKSWGQWDWRQAEKRLNELPQFHVEIEVDSFQNLDVHFVHQKSDVSGAIPLLFVHGCKPLIFIEPYSTLVSSGIHICY